MTNQGKFPKGHTPWNKGKPASPEALKNLSQKGRTPWNKGTTGLLVAWNKGEKGLTGRNITSLLVMSPATVGWRLITFLVGVNSLN